MTAPREHTFTVTVTGCTAEQADTVMRERIHVDEDDGFDYQITYAAEPAEDGGLRC